MTLSPRVRRMLSGALCATALGLGTLVLPGETQRAQVSNGLPYLIFDDAKATVSNGTNLSKTTPARKVSGQGMNGSYTALVQGQSLVWKNSTALPAGMYDVFSTGPAIPGSAEYANLSGFLVNEHGKSTNVTYSVPLIGNGLRTESFQGQEWQYLGRMHIEQNGILYSMIFSTHAASTGRETPVDGILLRGTSNEETGITLSYPGGYIERGEKTVQADVHDGGRPIAAGTYTVSAAWDAVPDLTQAEKKNPQTTTPSPYMQLEVFGTVAGGSIRAFEFKQALDLRKASTGIAADGKQWRQVGTIDIPAGLKTIKLKWTVTNVPGTTTDPGSAVRFPVLIHSAELHGAADSSSSASSAATTSSASSESSDEDEDEENEDEEDEDSSSSVSTSAASTTSASSSAPTLSISSSSSTVSVTPLSGDTAPIDLTPGSAVLDNTSANFYTNGFRAENGGYRNSYHGAAPAESVQSAVGGAYAGWRMPTLEHGEYDAYLTWPSVSGGSPAAPINISTVVPSNGTHLRISKTIIVNQSAPPVGPMVADKTWQKIGRITIDEFSGHNSVEFRVSDKTPGSKVLVDALLLRKIP